MLHILDAREPDDDNPILRAMFAARKSVFVDLLKWNVPVVAGSYEVDGFDGPEATYLVLADVAGAHLGSARLLRTDGAHILGSFYPELCAEAVPVGPRIREVTRFCLDRRLRAAERRTVRDTLVSALADHALAEGIESYTAIAEIGWFRQILDFGWRCRPLGPPHHRDGALLAALRIEIDAETPRLLRAAGIAPSLALAGDLRAAA
jgi:acyl-homoserine lactone synthase